MNEHEPNVHCTTLHCQSLSIVLSNPSRCTAQHSTGIHYYHIHPLLTHDCYFAWPANPVKHKHSCLHNSARAQHVTRVPLPLPLLG